MTQTSAIDDPSCAAAMQKLGAVIEEVDKFDYAALSYSDVVGGEPDIDRDEHADITDQVESLLQVCDEVAPHVAGAVGAAGFLDYARGRLYAVYLPRKFIKFVSHKDRAIECYQRAATSIPYPGMRAFVHYYWGRLHLVWDERKQAEAQFQAAVGEVGADTPQGQELERIRELLAS
jgi:hypothetical protein